MEKSTFQKAGEDVADPPEGEVGREMAGSQKLASLRERMESEKSRVLEYLERKNSHESDQILEDIEKLWRQTEEGKRETGRREPDDLLPEGWTDWWKLIYHQFSRAQRAEKITRARNMKKDYSERFLPNQLLLGWRGWWGRMEAESRKDLKDKQKMELKMKISRMKPIESFFMRSSGASSNSNGKKINSVQKFSSESDGQNCSPKRKLSNLSDMLSVGASPGKRRKVNFTQNLSFWRKIEGRGDTLSQMGPTNSAVRVKTSTYDGTNNTRREGVIGQNSPGGDIGLMQTKTQTNGDEP